MACEDRIYDNTYVDLLIDYVEGSFTLGNWLEDGCINAISREIAILHIIRSGNYLTNLEMIPYSYIPKLYGLMDSYNMEITGVKQVQNTNGLGLSGGNVIVGVIDTGIDYQNVLFRNRDGTSRIGVIWDQTIVSEQEEADDLYPRPIYGTVYGRNQINEALLSENPLELVPSVDENGHGTYMTGIAAGGIDLENDFVGAAPESEIAVVKLKEAKPYLREYYGIAEGIPAYSEGDIMYAVEYLLRYANMRRMPISILIGLGTSGGGHMGFTALERYLEEMLTNVGIMVSAPAGNEGNERLHYRGVITGEEEYDTVEMNVDENQQTLTMELWGMKPSTFGIGLISPQGDRIERIPPRFGKEELIRLPLADTDIYVAYQLVENYSGDEFVFIRLTKPTAGIWKILVYGNGDKQSVFNMWMPLRQFLRPNTYFLLGSPDNTITSPGNAKTVMTMTSYNQLNGSVYANAGRGYNERGQVKPDLAAPGVNVMGPGLRNNYVRRTGTSVAAAHAAGMLAQFLQWDFENPDLGIYFARQIQSFFLRNAIRQPEETYPNSIWGYGAMNIEAVFESFRITN